MWYRELSAEKKREGKDPVVILDGFVCGTYIYGDLDWMCGGQYKEYLDKLKQFMKSFEDAGIKLIIIMDGSCLKKQSVWVKRRYDMLHKSVYPVFDFLKNGKNCEPSGIVIPDISTKLMLTSILGAEVITSLQDADYKIAKAARDNDAIGIFSQDSDFLIYQTGVPLLSIADLNIETLRTKVFDPRRLASGLNLSSRQLPILAVLVGNDRVEKKLLEKLHSQLVGYRKRLILSLLLPALAEIVRNIDHTFLRNPSAMAKYIANNIIEDDSITEVLEETITEYFLDLSSSPAEPLPDYKNANWMQIIEKIQKGYIESRGIGYLYSIMVLQYYRSSGALEDYRQSC